MSPWIENIYNQKKIILKLQKEKFIYLGVKVKNLGLKRPTELNKIYKKIKNHGFKLVKPDIALRTRLNYKEQTTGEWLRFATSFNDLIDDDGVPHLPKLGKALGTFY